MVRIFIRDEDECDSGAVSAPETLQQFKVPVLFGRNAELEQLHHAWSDSATHLFAISAPSGAGKTALIERWLYDLQQHYWYDAESVYAWSFYPKIPTITFDQAPKELAQRHEKQRFAALCTAVDEFFHHALAWFGHATTETLEPQQQAEQLARKIQANHSLLVLDELEPFLTNDNGDLAFSDPRLSILFAKLNEYQSGLCVIITQQPIQPLFTTYQSAKYLALPNLPPAAGVQLLRHKGVQGAETKLLEVVQDHESHALTLHLLGGYLAYWHQGNWLGLEHVPVLFDKQATGRHIRRILTANAHLLFNSSAETIVLLLSLSQQPLDRQTLLNVLQQIPSPWLGYWLSKWVKQHDTLGELVRPFKYLSKAKQRQVFRQLQQLGLLRVVGRKLYLPDAVRVFFKQQFRHDWPLAWQEARGLLDQYSTMLPTVTPIKSVAVEKPQIHQPVNDLPQTVVPPHPEPRRADHLPILTFTSQPIRAEMDIPPPTYQRVGRDVPIPTPPTPTETKPAEESIALTVATLPSPAVVPSFRAAPMSLSETLTLQPLAALMDVERMNQLIPQIEDFQRSLQILQQRTRKFQKSMRQLDKAVQSIH